MEWLNEPASWQRTGDVLTVSVDPGTDFWRETGYGYIRDSGHVYGEVLGGDLDVSVRVRCTLGVQYDQAGVMLRADERTWLKTGVEFFEGRPRLSTVLTLGRSSWMVTDLPVGTDDIVLRVSRRGDAVEVRYVLDDGPAELVALAFLPPGREVLAGVMGAAPEGPGFRVTFQDLLITERDWSAPADGVTTWPDDPARWAGGELPGWSRAEGEPGWAAPEAGAEATDWPGAAAEEDGSSWPLPAAAEDGPGWTAPEAGADEPGWPGPADVTDEPGWAGPAGEDAARPDRAPGGEPAADGPAGLGAVLPEPAVPGVEREPGAGEPAGGKPGPPDPPAPEAGNRETSSAPPARGPADWAPVAGREAVADWDRLAAGAQAGPAERWTAQADADVADEWPGPPLRTAVRNGPLARGAMSGPAAGHPPGDAQAGHGPAAPRPAEEAVTLPDQAAASAGPDQPAAAGDSAAKPGAAEPGAAEPKPPARESRWARSKRDAADPPAEPDAADEWISLLTADPVEE